MNLRRTFAAVMLSAATVFAAVVPAHADSSTNFRVFGNAYTDITLTLCGPHVRVNVDGNGRSDLDFEIYTADGTLIFADNDDTDFTTYVVNKANGCGAYTLRVINRGYHINDFRVDLTNT